MAHRLVLVNLDPPSRRMLAAVALALAAHGWLLGWTPTPPRWPLPQATRLTVSLAVPTNAALSTKAAAPATAAARRPDARPAATPTPAAQISPPRTPPHRARALGVTAPNILPALLRASAPAVKPLSQSAAERVEAMAEPPAEIEATDDKEAAGSGSEAAAVARSPSLPPPLYPAQPPPAVALHWSRPGDDRWRATLSWQPGPPAQDANHFRLQWSAQRGDALAQQRASQGLIAAHGLAPLRATERHGRRAERAVNFDAAAGHIRFSASSAIKPHWPGVQDGLSWLAQWAAIAQAAGAAGPPAEVQLYLADARGGTALWRLRRQAVETLDTPTGLRPARRWQHTPQEAEGLEVTLWTAEPPDAADPWPLRWRLHALGRGGRAIEWQRAAPP